MQVSPSKFAPSLKIVAFIIFYSEIGVMETKKNVFLWILYDFANSLVSIVFFLYFAQWIVIDRGISDLHFNLTFTISALLLLFTAPFTVEQKWNNKFTWREL